MHIVDGLFVGTMYSTHVWISEAALKAVEKYTKHNNKDAIGFLEKVEYYAEAGFGVFEGSRDPIRHEGGGVYRVANKTTSLFRLIGFYETGKESFIIIDAFKKKGRKLSASERGRIARVAKVKKDRAWRRR